MFSYSSISTDKLSRLIGTPTAPTLIDGRIDEDFAADPRLIPGAVRRSHRDMQDWAGALTGERRLPYTAIARICTNTQSHGPNERGVLSHV